jgi:Uma2 family endonuclease
MTVATQKMTLEQFLAYDDGTENRYELVDGVPVNMGVESTINGQIAVYLIFVFAALGISQQCLGIKQKIEVNSTYASARDPDLIIHSPGSCLAIKGRSEACLFLNEPNPLIVIEIVSPGPESTDNYQRDYEQKPKEYADRGIAEFWQVDPSRSWVRIGTLVDAAYQFVIYQGNQAIVSPTFAALQPTAAAILTAGDEPNL